MGEHTSRIEVVWGHRLLDEGFTSIPNIIIRNYRKLGIEHGEWGFICTLLTYKHDERDPYPSQETLAGHLDVSVRQIKKWVDSLVQKQLLLVGQRRNVQSKQFGNAVYNFKPLIQAALKLVGESPLPDSSTEWDIEYRNTSVFEVHSAPSEPEVHMGSEPEVHTDPVPEVHPKITSNKRHIENKNNNVVVVREQIESNLGTSIKSLLPKLRVWIDTYGANDLIKRARYMRNKPGVTNVVGAYRRCVEESWDIEDVTVRKSNDSYDPRYDAVYKLFPELLQGQ